MSAYSDVNKAVEYLNNRLSSCYDQLEEYEAKYKVQLENKISHAEEVLDNFRTQFKVVDEGIDDINNFLNDTIKEKISQKEAMYKRSLNENKIF